METSSIFIKLDYSIVNLEKNFRLKIKHEGKLPQNYKEKDAFKELIKAGNSLSNMYSWSLRFYSFSLGILKNEDEVPKFEENFEEALRNVNNSITKTQVIFKAIEV